MNAIILVCTIQWVVAHARGCEASLRRVPNFDSVIDVGVYHVPGGLAREMPCVHPAPTPLLPPKRWKPVGKEPAETGA